ncbi:Carboxyl-terminal-processing peptidase 2, chloroplastic [Asimina triloba]
MDLAIKKMVAALGDPFTRFLEPDKFRSLRSGTQGSFTGVGLSIGYPTGLDASPSGLVVISSTPGGPANRAGIMPGDIILSIDSTSTEAMGLFDAAERLQGPEGSSVELAVLSGPEIKQLALKREKVSLNPVKSRLCEVQSSGNDSFRIGYIKLTSFNLNASDCDLLESLYLSEQHFILFFDDFAMHFDEDYGSGLTDIQPGAVKQAIETLRRNNVNAFVLDLRNNRLDKGVIVYICDSRGIRDIYESDGMNAIAASEPLVVLVNRGTASSSEILAAALKDNKRAVVLGEPTFGKGKIQSVFELSDGSGLAVTVARYETPAHNDIDKNIYFANPLTLLSSWIVCGHFKSAFFFLNEYPMYAAIFLVSFFFISFISFLPWILEE